MLVKYKNDYEKIAMGLLSFIPDLKDVGHLKTELKMYTEDDSHALYCINIIMILSVWSVLN